MNSDAGRFTLVYLAAPGDSRQATEHDAPLLELTYNWDTEDYTGGRNFGHLAFEVENIYQVCQNLMDHGVCINRPPRDGWMAFIRSPDQISIELLQKGSALPKQEPWASMPNVGVW
jgi:lactoylglutathione lyase